MPAPEVKSKKSIPPPKPPKRPKAGPKVHGKDALTVPTRVAKDFTVKAWSAENEGQKTMLFGAFDIGKTSLAALLDNPVFIGADDGGRLIKNPHTGADLMRVPEVVDFQDVRDVLQSNTLDGYSNIVIDTITEIQRWAIEYVLQTMPKITKGSSTYMKKLTDYGYREGWEHWLRAIELLLNDCDRHIRAGRNIVLIAQRTGTKIDNQGGDDYRATTPALHHDNQTSILNYVCEWCDHIFLLDQTNLMVEDGKVRSNLDRAVFIHTDASKFTKSRTIGAEWTSVEFKDKTDDSIWRLLKDPTGGE